MCLRAVGWLINQHVMGIHRHYGIEIVVFLIIIIAASHHQQHQHHNKQKG